MNRREALQRLSLPALAPIAPQIAQSIKASWIVFPSKAYHHYWIERIIRFAFYNIPIRINGRFDTPFLKDYFDGRSL